MSMKIRAYQENDEQAVISLWCECGLVVAQNDPKKDIERKLQVNRDLFIVGVSEGAIVATVMGGYDGHRGWINYLAVKPSEQRKGFGKRMMYEIEHLISLKGCPKINLQIRNSNLDVLAFYTSIGYSDDLVVGLGKRLEHDT